MDKINNIGLSRMLTSAYDFDGFTSNEVWSRIAQKINIIIEHFNYLDKKIENEKENNKAKFDYLLGEGLTEQVAKALLEKIKDGTLGDLINNTSLRDINLKLNDINDKKTESNKLFKRRIVNQFPLQFNDYFEITNNENVSNIYPQSFAIDSKTKELFVVFSPTSGNSTKRWIVVYDIQAGKYKSCFHAGDSGGEGIVVKYENNTRYLYVKTTESKLGKFLIDILPINKSSIQPINEFNVGLHWQFAYSNGYWYIEQQGAIFGQYIRRNLISKYDENFNKIGEIYMNATDIGLFNSEYSDYISKRQGFTIYNGNFILGLGGYYEKNTPNIPYSNYGIGIVNMEGTRLERATIRSDKFIELLESKNITCSRIENESVYSIDNKVYSLCVNLSPRDSEAEAHGIIIFEEMASNDYIDCSLISDDGSTFNKNTYEGVILPRSSDGQIYNPLTGMIMDSMDKILDFMINIDLKNTSFYSSSSKVLWFDGKQIPTSILVKINNCNNSSFNIELINNKDIKRYWIYGETGNRTINQVKNDYDTGWIDITLANDISPYDERTTPQYRRYGAIVYIRGAVKGISSRNQVIGTIPSDEFNPNEQSHQYIAPITTIDGTTRIGRYNITTDGIITIENTSDNEYLNDRWHSLATSFMI